MSLKPRSALAGAAVACTVALTATSHATAGDPEQSVARQWNEALLLAINNDFARPPVHARNLYHISAAMWDAWAVYDPAADGIFTDEKQTARNVKVAREEAISHAAYNVLKVRFANSPGKDVSLPYFDQLMDDLGYDKDFDSLVGNSPAAIGNRCANTILTTQYDDGSNEENNYAPVNYEPVNPPLIVDFPGNPDLIDPNRWQPLSLEYFKDQGKNPIPWEWQIFLGPHWGFVTPFALSPDDLHPEKPGVYHDPGPPPQFAGEGHEIFVEAFVDVVVKSSILDPTIEEFIDISPGAWGNNPLGENSGTGYPVNPVTGQPYEPNVVQIGDFGRIMAEYWADGPHSETPPGHWNVIANEKVSDYPGFEKRIGGTGPIVDDLEWDVKLYLAINSAGHDVAVACWGVKGYYDYIRPISAIRYMADLGQSSDSKLPSYHPHGLPLIDGIVELITEESAARGERHAHLAEFIGEIAVLGWPGVPEDPETQFSGVEWIRANEWLPYQRPTFVTPPFAGYTSGHSTYSRAAARVLTEFTGSEFFPGGLAEWYFPQGEGLHFEYGPSEDFVLQAARYYDASDQASQSRIYGGIHPWIDDFPGRIMGHQIGKDVYDRSTQYFNGQISCQADLDGSGAIDGQDLALLLGSWGPCPRGQDCGTDLNGDGIVDASDLSILLIGWGECAEF